VKYAILTFGCRVNQADSFDLEADLRASGGEAAPVEEADLVLVNTCSVTATAEQAARQAIRRVARVNPTARVVATGCYVARRPADFAALPVAQVLTRAEAPWPSALPGPGTRGRTLFLLRVQTGCDQRCAYCVVPATRGRSRSVPLEHVAARVSAAAAAGFREVMVTGVHLGSWGRDLQPAWRLRDLVRALAAHPGDVRFRLSAIEPMDVDGDLVDEVAAAGRFAPQFHLPLQHASDRLLSAMRRPYTLAAYDAGVARLRARFADAAITTDLIVGFPGETEADFESCVRYLAGSSLTGAHVFPFSPRPGTPAAGLRDRPGGADVRQRVSALRAVAADRSRQFRQRFVGEVRDGLTIGDGSLVLTDNGLKVRTGAGLPRNRRVRVRIEEDGEPMKGAVAETQD
jgi:threonylcarbamoyladenosine tRNA methylthiotransferase MtaB